MLGASCYSRPGVSQAADDSELVRRIGAAPMQSRADESELCARLAPRVRLYGLKHLRDRDRADDLVQQVLVALLEAVREGRIEDPERLPRFVLGICRNMVTRLRVQASRLTTVSPEALDVPFEDVGPARVSPARLYACLEKLDERAFAVVRMSFMEERLPGEIADALGTTQGNVRVIRHRAVARLQKCLGIEEERS